MTQEESGVQAKIMEKKRSGTSAKTSVLQVWFNAYTDDLHYVHAFELPVIVFQLPKNKRAASPRTMVLVSFPLSTKDNYMMAVERPRRKKPGQRHPAQYLSKTI